MPLLRYTLLRLALLAGVGVLLWLLGLRGLLLALVAVVVAALLSFLLLPNVNFWQLLIIFLLRTVITLPIIIGIAHLIF